MESHDFINFKYLSILYREPCVQVPTLYNHCTKSYQGAEVDFKLFLGSAWA